MKDTEWIGVFIWWGIITLCGFCNFLVEHRKDRPYWLRLIIALGYTAGMWVFPLTLYWTR